MKCNQVGSAALFSLCLLSSSFAGETPATTGKSNQNFDLLLHPRAAASDYTPIVTANAEVFSGILIAAGKSVSLDSTLDYSAVSTVAVTVQCIICNSANNSLGSSGLVLQAAWMVPGSTFVAPESKAATAFPYWDSGGALFNVYGPQFRLILQNQGNQSIAVQQVTIFRRGQASQ